ncbi:NTF2-like N-terminal transpeptidase domain-containing protein [Streptosporangium sp. NPDC001681]|uniref:NTF2-like N-terminal transpeptidase domain-containing protein n=1 Tax=Streptosporangium sp. NPDC001681 TaxID=3154395 RepID=UPI00332C3C0F
MRLRHLATATALVLAAASAGTVWALHTEGSPEETAEMFLTAWGRQDYPAMRALTVEPPDDFERWYRRFRTDLKLTGAAFSVLGDARDGEPATVGFRATLEGPVNWAYEGSLRLVEHERTWRVEWSPTAVHPRLGTGLRIKTMLVKAEPRKLEPEILRALRTLMPAVVVEGTASAVPFPSGTAGKTGTAEFGSGKEPPSHAWFIGYRGDLAFSIVVEGGGAGSTVAAPIASRFLTGLPQR